MFTSVLHRVLLGGLPLYYVCAMSRMFVPRQTPSEAEEIRASFGVIQADLRSTHYISLEIEALYRIKMRHGKNYTLFSMAKRCGG